MPLADWQFPRAGNTDYSSMMGRTPAGIPGLNFQALYNPAAYGSIPNIPPTSTDRSTQNQLSTGLTDTLSNLLNTSRTTEDTNTTGFSNTQSVMDTIRNILSSTHDVTSWIPNIPGYEGLAGASSEDVANWLAGRLDPEAIADAASWAANRGITTGLGMMSPNAASAYQHFLGLTRQGLQEKGLQYYLQLLAQSPRTTTHDVSSSQAETGQTTTTSQTQTGSNTRRVLETVAQQLGTTVQNVLNAVTGGATNTRDNNLLRAYMAAAPQPMAAALANLAAQQVGTQAGTTAGTRAPTAVAPTMSFPSSFPYSPAYTRPDTYSSVPQWYGSSFGGYGATPVGSPGGSIWGSGPAAIGYEGSWDTQAHNNAGVSFQGIGTPGPYGPMQLAPQDDPMAGPIGLNSYDPSYMWEFDDSGYWG